MSLSRRDDIISLMYLLIYCVNSNLSWIDIARPIADQFDEIGRYKLCTKAQEFCSNSTKFLYPLLKYAYRLRYTERPDYDKIKFMFMKILLDKDYLPDNKFDWSLKPGESFQKVDRNDNHSSISSCSIGPDE